MIKNIFRVLLILCVGGCAQVKTQTLAEQQTGYTYIPIDPFPVISTPDVECLGRNTSSRLYNAMGKNESEVNKELSSKHHLAIPLYLYNKFPYKSLLKSLPDNAVRMLVEEFQTQGSVSFAAGKIGAKNTSYRVTVDYINADTVSYPVQIKKSIAKLSDNSIVQIPLIEKPDFTKYKEGSEQYVVTRRRSASEVFWRSFSDKGKDKSNEVQEPINSTSDEFNIPVYVGIGLRLIANVTTLTSDANISGIGIIGAEAEANHLKGSLTVQTLGVNGKSISAALPIQSELNRTTAQNAIVAVGQIKALLYTNETDVSPRIVGIYLPFPADKALVNSIISAMSKDPIEWPRECVYDTTDKN